MKVCQLSCPWLSTSKFIACARSKTQAVLVTCLTTLITESKIHLKHVVAEFCNFACNDLLHTGYK